MKRYFPITMMAIVVLAVVGCSQEGNQGQSVDSSDTSGEITTAETGDSAAAGEHTTLKPDISAADDAQEVDSGNSAKPDANVENGEETTKAEE